MMTDSIYTEVYNVDDQKSTFESLKANCVANRIEALSNRFVNDSSSTLKIFSLIEPITDYSAENVARSIETNPINSDFSLTLMNFGPDFDCTCFIHLV